MAQDKTGKTIPLNANGATNPLYNATNAVLGLPNQDAGDYMQGYAPYSREVENFQKEWNTANPSDQILVDGKRGKQTTSRIDKVRASMSAPLTLELAPEQQPLSPTEYTAKYGTNPASMFLDGMRPKPEDTERINV